LPAGASKLPRKPIAPCCSLDRFRHLNYALAALLVFIGSKVFVADLPGIGEFPPAASLGATSAILATGMGGSLWKTRDGTVVR